MSKKLRSFEMVETFQWKCDGVRKQVQYMANCYEYRILYTEKREEDAYVSYSEATCLSDNKARVEKKLESYRSIQRIEED